jgi:hypothetical protein
MPGVTMALCRLFAKAGSTRGKYSTPIKAKQARRQPYCFVLRKFRNFFGTTIIPPSGKLHPLNFNRRATRSIPPEPSNLGEKYCDPPPPPFFLRFLLCTDMLKQVTDMMDTLRVSRLYGKALRKFNGNHHLLCLQISCLFVQLSFFIVSKQVGL